VKFARFALGAAGRVMRIPISAASLSRALARVIKRLRAVLITAGDPVPTAVADSRFDLATP
jgi:hypothetical protein